MSRHATNGYSSYSTWAAALIINNTYWIYRELQHAMETAWQDGKNDFQAVRHIIRELCNCGCLGMDTECEGACPISRRSLKEIAEDEWQEFKSWKLRENA